jgi:hypothetical protein
MRTRLDEVDRLRRQVVQRAQQEAELSRRRYLRVDPDNRLVVDQLEADWNSKLRTLHTAQEEYEQQKEKDQKIFRAEQREKILALATNFPRVWNDPSLPHRERKRVARLLVEDVSMQKSTLWLPRSDSGAKPRESWNFPFLCPFMCAPGPCPK